MDKLSEIFVKNVLRRLLENRLAKRVPGSRPELAKMLGVTTQAIANHLRRDVRLSTVQEYAGALKCQPWELLLEPKES